jgi:hypothetical protein
MDRMNAEIAAYDAYIRDRLSRAVACLDGLTATQLNWRPPLDGANSVYALASHTLGNARAWVLGIACDRPIGRNRPGQFAAAGAGAASLRDDLQLLSRQITAPSRISTPRGSTAVSYQHRNCGARTRPARSPCATHSCRSSSTPRCISATWR